ncbi:hypothetical protein [Sphingorhabdus sp. EL138]|uniref:phosphoribosyltransferase-like protein n=1 Tax=Sphingorhabdus sp. EL138 TaxID=2073156 RepID=UPI000D69EB09|nr:hypothetical protein [Sphingorhabdus sp. EL138]
MQRELAEKLLARIMNWETDVKAAERAALEAFADYKYDEYQQYAPGRRFLESLALWLRQFETIEERQIAYKFVRERLVFISNAEINYLVSLSFPSFVRPHLIEMTARQLGISPHRVKLITNTVNYRTNLRRTLFLGLSDGAQTDRFRRANPLDISNEQIWHAYDISTGKVGNLKKKLEIDVAKLNDSEGGTADPTFQTIILLDDFTASGTSYLRKAESGDWDGKIHKILDMLDNDASLGSLVAKQEVSVIIVLYVAAPQAIDHILPLLEKRGFARGNIEFRIAHKLGSDTKLSLEYDADILNLVGNDKYWDENADDDHAKVGGKSFRNGYADCKLPVILGHNTPNNSIFLLWAEDISNVLGLFPRVSRHRKFE